MADFTVRNLIAESCKEFVALFVFELDCLQNSLTVELPGTKSIFPLSSLEDS